MIIQRDKVEHFLGGFAIAMIVAILLFLAGIPLVYACCLGAITAAIIGAWKEWIYDAARPTIHTVDVFDFLATASGGITGASFVFVCVLLII